MVIRFTVSIPSRRIKEFTGQIAKSPPLPEYITKRGPYINGTGGADNKIITTYEFDKSRLAEAWKSILKQLEVLQGVPGLSLSAQIWEEGTEVKNCGLVEGIAEVLKANTDSKVPSEFTADSIDPGRK